MRTACSIIILAGLIWTGCTGEKPRPDEALTAAYADLLRYRQSGADLDSAAYAAGADSLLAGHGFTRESFLDRFQELGTTAGQINAFFDRVAVDLKPPKDTLR